MTSPTPSAGLLLTVALVVGIAGCGASSTAGGSPSPSREGTSSVATTTIVRTGGIAGVRDTVTIGVDGTGHVTTKAGRKRPCTPSAAALRRLHGIDLAAVAATSPSAPRPDAYAYDVRIGERSASAAEGDDDGRRAELVDAAAAIVSACLA
jgi:hypothetical protein